MFSQQIDELCLSSAHHQGKQKQYCPEKSCEERVKVVLFAGFALFSFLKLNDDIHRPLPRGVLPNIYISLVSKL